MEFFAKVKEYFTKKVNIYKKHSELNVQNAAILMFSMCHGRALKDIEQLRDAPDDLLDLKDQHIPHLDST